MFARKVQCVHGPREEEGDVLAVYVEEAEQFAQLPFDRHRKGKAVTVAEDHGRLVTDPPAGGVDLDDRALVVGKKQISFIPAGREPQVNSLSGLLRGERARCLDHRVDVPRLGNLSLLAVVSPPHLLTEFLAPDVDEPTRAELSEGFANLVAQEAHVVK